MKHKYIFLLFTMSTVFTALIYGQNKIGNNPATINGGSLLELESTSKGLLLPRIPLDDVTKWTLDGIAVNGMLIFADGTGAQAKGIYYWNSTQWSRVINSDELSALIVNYTTVSNSSTGNKLKTTVNGKVADEVSIINAITNTLTGNILETSVNGIKASVDLSPIVTANTTNSLTANDNYTLKSDVNGVISDLTPATGVVAKTLGFDATGKLVNQDASAVAITNDLSISGNTLTTNVNNVSKSANVVNGFTNTLTGNTLETSVNGIKASVDLSPIVTANTTNSLTANDNYTLKSDVNGVISDLTPATGVVAKTLGFDATGKLVNQDASAVAITNDLSISGNTLTTNVNNVSKSANVVNGFTNTLTGNTLETSVNGIKASVDLSPIVTANTTNSLTANDNYTLKSDVNGVISDLTPATGVVAKTLGFDATGKLVNQDASAVAITNDLSISGNTLTTNVNNVSKSANVVNGFTNTLTGNTLETSVNGIKASVDLSPIVAATVTTNANLTGEVTSIGNTTTITDKAVTLAKMNDLSAGSFIGRNSTNAGTPEALDLATVRTMLSIPADASFNIDRNITLPGLSVTGQNLGAGGKTMAQFFEAFFFPAVAATPPTSTLTTTTTTFPYSTWKSWGNPPSSNLSFAWSVTNLSLTDNTDDKAITSIKLKTGVTELANATPTGGNQSGSFTGIPFANTVLDAKTTFTKTYTLEVIDAQPQTVLKNIVLTMSPAIRLAYSVPTLTPATTVYEYDVNNKDITLNWAITPNDENITNISVDGNSTGSTSSTGTQAVTFKTIANGGSVSKAFPLVVTGSIYGAGTAQNSATVSWDNRLYRGTITSPIIPNDGAFTFTDTQVKALASETKLGGNWKSAAGYDFVCGTSGQYVVFAYPDDNVTPVVQYYDSNFNSWMTYTAADLNIISRANFVNQNGYTETNYKIVIVCVQYFGQTVKIRIQ